MATAPPFVALGFYRMTARMVRGTCGACKAPMRYDPERAATIRGYDSPRPVCLACATRLGLDADRTAYEPLRVRRGGLLGRLLSR